MYLYAEKKRRTGFPLGLTWHSRAHKHTQALSLDNIQQPRYLNPNVFRRKPASGRDYEHWLSRSAAEGRIQKSRWARPGLGRSPQWGRVAEPPDVRFRTKLTKAEYFYIPESSFGLQSCWHINVLRKTHSACYVYRCSWECIIQNCAKLFLSEFRQISTNVDNFWRKDDKEAKIMRGALRVILASLCQKLSKLMQIWRTSDKNDFVQLFGDTV